MTIEELRSQTRTALEQTLNQLQSAILLVAQLEAQVSNAGETVQNLSQIIEQYINEVTNTTPTSLSTPEGTDPPFSDLDG